MLGIRINSFWYIISPLLNQVRASDQGIFTSVTEFQTRSSKLLYLEGFFLVYDIFDIQIIA